MIFQKNFPLQNLNTLGLQSSAQNFVSLKNSSDLKTLLEQEKWSSQWHILGGGSNIVLPPEVQGWVIKPDFKGISLLNEDSEAWYIAAASGESWHHFVQDCLAHGYYGLENLSLIPGTVGAAPIQNIGAYGAEIKDFIEQVEAVDLRSGNIKLFSQRECDFSYRDSIFKKSAMQSWMITKVVFKLKKKNLLRLDYGEVRKTLQDLGLSENPVHVAQAIIKIRTEKLPDPQHLGNAGSFFKNPVVPQAQRDELLQRFPNLVSYATTPGQYKLAAGWLIDQCGWKGQSMGPVGVYHKQALVLVNHGGASLKDIKTLSDAIIASVLNKFHVTLEPEPQFWV